MARTLPSYADAERMDAVDPLAAFRGRFVPTTPGLLALNGASLGRLPAATGDLVADVVGAQWGAGLANARTQWLDLPVRVGDRIASVALGAHPKEVVAGDCTSVNLYKLAAAALAARPGRTTVVTDDDNFPTDRYVLAGVATAHGGHLRTVHADPVHGLDLDVLRAAIDDTVALVSLSLVSYRSSALLDMAAVNAIVRDAGALMLWDLSHGAGAVPIELAATGADLAVGSTAKHLHAGPGAPAFLYVRRDLQVELAQPIHGWYGHRDQLSMLPDYDPDPTIRRFLTGTPPIVSLAAANGGLDVIADAGMHAIRTKSQALTGLLLELADAHLAPLGFELASPREGAHRGAHLTFEHPTAAKLQATLAAHGLLVDNVLPGRLRFAPDPLCTRFTDVFGAVDRMLSVLGDRVRIPFATRDTTGSRT